MGGYDGTDQLNSTERYDVESDTWTFVAPMRYRRSALGVTVYQGKIYVLGGWGPGGPTGVPGQDLHVGLVGGSGLGGSVGSRCCNGVGLGSDCTMRILGWLVGVPWGSRCKIYTLGWWEVRDWGSRGVPVL